MSDLVFNSRTADKFVVRLPDGLREEVDAVATAQSTSMNSIFIRAARQFVAGQRRQELLLDALVAANESNAAPVANIDDHIQLVADARRYRHLRDRECIEDASTDLLVIAGDTYFTGAELDKQIDDAIRLATLLELHGEPA
jgi:metal-responsive CopG/Arc/MetJ family transcriptional regulator